MLCKLPVATCEALLADGALALLHDGALSALARVSPSSHVPLFMHHLRNAKRPRTRETRVPERKRRTSADGALGMLRRTQSHYCARDAAAADASVSKTPNLERRRLSLRGERSGGSGSGSGACASPRCDDY